MRSIVNVLVGFFFVIILHPISALAQGGVEVSPAVAQRLPADPFDSQLPRSATAPDDPELRLARVDLGLLTGAESLGGFSPRLTLIPEVGIWVQLSQHWGIRPQFWAGLAPGSNMLFSLGGGVGVGYRSYGDGFRLSLNIGGAWHREPTDRMNSTGFYIGPRVDVKPWSFPVGFVAEVKVGPSWDVLGGFYPLWSVQVGAAYHF